jgi:hypothetical protein
MSDVAPAEPWKDGKEGVRLPHVEAEGRVEPAADLRGESPRERRLSQSGLAREEDMAHGLSAIQGAPDCEEEPLDHPFLADDLGEGLGADARGSFRGTVDLASSSPFGCDSALEGPGRAKDEGVLRAAPLEALLERSPLGGGEGAGEVVDRLHEREVERGARRRKDLRRLRWRTCAIMRGVGLDDPRLCFGRSVEVRDGVECVSVLRKRARRRNDLRRFRWRRAGACREASVALAW